MTELNVSIEAEMLCELVYKITMKLPNSEMFGLTSQLRRASVSIVSNLTEGNSYLNGNQLVLFERAYGSCREVQVQLKLMKKIFDIDTGEVYNLADKVGGMIFKLMSAVRSRQS
jgi:four helix bundle protein